LLKEKQAKGAAGRSAIAAAAVGLNKSEPARVSGAGRTSSQASQPCGSAQAQAATGAALKRPSLKRPSLRRPPVEAKPGPDGEDDDLGSPPSKARRPDGAESNPGRKPDGSTLFVGDLPPGTTKMDLLQWFETMAPVVSARALSGFGFVTFEDRSGASQVCPRVWHGLAPAPCPRGGMIWGRPMVRKVASRIWDPLHRGSPSFCTVRVLMVCHVWPLCTLGEMQCRG